MEPLFERERIARRGFKTRNHKLIALGQVDEHRSIKTINKPMPFGKA